MRTEDLKLIEQMGQALYASPDTAHSRSLETMAALSTLPELGAEESFKKVTQLLLNQAEREGIKATAQGVSNPFYRLSPIERLIVAFLHSGQLSYSRLALLLGHDVEAIQAMAWQARLKMASSAEVQLTARYPAPVSKLKHSCPEYLEERPWTQKLLDDEMKSTELSFIQNHCFVCEGCTRALKQSRELYYAVEKLIPIRVLEGITDDEILEKLRRKASFQKPMSNIQAVQVFLSRKTTWLMLAILAAVIFFTGKF